MSKKFFISILVLGFVIGFLVPVFVFATDEYDTANLIITSYLPQILMFVFFPFLVLGVALKFMRNP